MSNDEPVRPILPDPPEPPPIPPGPVVLLRECCVRLAVETHEGWMTAALLRDALEQIIRSAARKGEVPRLVAIARAALESERAFSRGKAMAPGAVAHWAKGHRHGHLR